MVGCLGGGGEGRRLIDHPEKSAGLEDLEDVLSATKLEGENTSLAAVGAPFRRTWAEMLRNHPRIEQVENGDSADATGSLVLVD